MKPVLLALCFCLTSCNLTPEQKAGMRAAAISMNESNQQAAYQRQADNNYANQNAVNYLQQRSLIQQQSQQNDLNNFRQQSYQHDLDRRLDNIERNTDPHRAF